MTNVMLRNKSLHSADFLSMGAMDPMGTLIQHLYFLAIFTARLRVAPKPVSASSSHLFHAECHWGLCRRDFFKMPTPRCLGQDQGSQLNQPLIEPPTVCTQFGTASNVGQDYDNQFPGLPTPGNL